LNDKAVLLALEKISKNTGEDEDDEIFTLEREFNIKITEDEVSTLRDVLINESVWIWVLKPYTSKDYEKEKLHLIKCSLSADKFLKKKELDGRFFIKYLERIILSRVHDSIFEDLLEEHEIEYKNLTKSEWEDIIASKQFKKAEIQVAREFIASKLSKKCEAHFFYKSIEDDN